MEGDKVYKVGQNSLSFEDYKEKYKRSIEDNDNFWGEEGKRINWIKPYTKVKEYFYGKSDTQIKWYYDGTLNITYNCIDRHIEAGHGEATALIWEGNDAS
jgi:acetyl-CoA synthetase